MKNFAHPGHGLKRIALHILACEKKIVLLLRVLKINVIENFGFLGLRIHPQIIKPAAERIDNESSLSLPLEVAEMIRAAQSGFMLLTRQKFIDTPDGDAHLKIAGRRPRWLAESRQAGFEFVVVPAVEGHRDAGEVI